jgi:SAM-dependent methyltransferase
MNNFSIQSDQYAKYRPQYPKTFFDYINSIVQNKESAWDCGTGNGQMAAVLAETFDRVFATDMSQEQIDNAIQKPNIFYSVQIAENTNLMNEQFDIIIVAQAIHWFDFSKFYDEVRRTLKKSGFLCVVGYGRIEISEKIDPVIQEFYTSVIGPYWDKERKYIDESYQTIPFPFNEISTPTFNIEYQWTLSHLIGYLNTWSAVKNYIKEHGFNPVEDLHKKLQTIWEGNEAQRVSFPLFVRLGTI